MQGWTHLITLSKAPYFGNAPTLHLYRRWKIIHAVGNLHLWNQFLLLRLCENEHCSLRRQLLTLLKKNYQDAKEKKWWCIWNTPMLWSSRICLLVIWHQHDSCKHCYGSSFNPQSALPKSNSHSSCFYQHLNFLTSEVCKIGCQRIETVILALQCNSITLTYTTIDKEKKRGLY